MIHLWQKNSPFETELKLKVTFNSTGVSVKKMTPM